jgi:arylsulfatase A-like enzyme
MEKKWQTHTHHPTVLSFALFIVSVNFAFSLPNVIVFFADNLGYSDIGAFTSTCTNGTTKTPNIDKLASEGIKLKNWNSAAALCSASRSALLTGKYPVRTGVFPGVFKPDAENGLSPDEVTIAEYLKEKGYATSIIGKWHLGQREEYLPTNQGFDEWYGIPYHMSGGSIDSHLCGFDTDGTIWLPLFEGTHIVEQPVDLTNLAQRYASRGREFIRKSVEQNKPFFLYFPFSHVHQLCAPQQSSCQWASSQFSINSPNATFYDAVEEMDWITGEIIRQLDDSNVANETLVIFTSDNGPWLAEQSCSGSKGPFLGKWFLENAPSDCTACPHDYYPSPTLDRPHRCIFQGEHDLWEMDGVKCGEDVGLGSCWEANVIMPGIARWPGHIPSGTETTEMVSTLDVMPTILSLTGITPRDVLDGINILPILYQDSERIVSSDRILFFWRDGFREGPLPPPFGRYDVVAAKLGRIKAWIYTKSSHYNPDEEVYHDPPLLFDVLSDPAEAYPLDPADYSNVVEEILLKIKEHKESITRGNPLTISRDPKYLPCSNRKTNCRSHFVSGLDSIQGINSDEIVLSVNLERLVPV